MRGVVSEVGVERTRDRGGREGVLSERDQEVPSTGGGHKEKEVGVIVSLEFFFVGEVGLGVVLRTKIS